VYGAELAIVETPEEEDWIKLFLRNTWAHGTLHVYAFTDKCVITYMYMHVRANIRRGPECMGACMRVRVFVYSCVRLCM
jgi:hypothetical protein